MASMSLGCVRKRRHPACVSLGHCGLRYNSALATFDKLSVWIEPWRRLSERQIVTNGGYCDSRSMPSCWPSASANAGAVSSDTSALMLCPQSLSAWGKYPAPL
jgi:hypothetical protein